MEGVSAAEPMGSTQLPAPPTARFTETGEEVSASVVRTRAFWPWAAVLIARGLLVIRFGMSNLLNLVDLATILSFATGPFMAILTYRAMTSPDIPDEFRPSPRLRGAAIAGIIFLLGFLGFFLHHRFLAG
jgi:hypothetical protein